MSSGGPATQFTRWFMSQPPDRRWAFVLTVFPDALPSAPDVEEMFPDLPETALSVSRLARVFAAHFGPSYFPNMTDVTIHGRSPEEIAEQVAAEYAALRDSGS